ncbi:MAG: NYN domain-containing protein [Acidobacteriia bacterium]|nr:NYN domain-containing protein [Terriglobia bacterium]
MDRVLVYVDWENIHYTLEKIYRVDVPALECLKTIIVRAKEYGRPHVEVYYNDHLGRRDHDLGRAIRACGAYAQPISSARVEKNLADTYIATDAIRQYIHQKPSVVIIVSGDNGYSPVLRAIKDEGGEALIFSFKKSMANVFQDSMLVDEPIILDELILPHGTPLASTFELKQESTTSKKPESTANLVVQLPPPRSVRSQAAPKRVQRTAADFIDSPTSGSAIRIILRLTQALAHEFGENIYTRDNLPAACSSESEEWTPILDVVHEAIATGKLSVLHKNRTGVADDYVPNWEHPSVRSVLLAWVAFVEKLRYMAPGAAQDTPKELILSQICPSEKEKALYYSPDRALLEAVMSEAEGIGALIADTTKTMVRLDADHPLVKTPIRLQIPFQELPKALQSNIRALEKDIVAISSTGSARLSALKQRFGKRANTLVDLGVALGLLSPAGALHDNKTMITSKRTSDPAKTG